MGEILLLDQNTINKIAAGEVVERPSAVVKELIEYAIDAGANAITVEIKGGGIEFIRITDNGAGIPKEQIKIAFERHATSKIRSVEDLLSVSSLGFRGEALASISAVSQVELVTKTRGELTGSRYVIEGGQEKSLDEIGCPEGTTFVVRNLFFNTPARRKFLKSAQTEAAYISDFVERLAISHPTISFKFMNNNQLKLHTSGNGNIKDIIYHVYGRDITAQLLDVNKNAPAISMKGFVAKPIVSRGNRNYMNYFINGRYIKSAIINKAIEEAYKPYSMQHRYPMTALHFEIDSQFMDVNVHPTKMEVRFTNGQAIYQTIFDAITNVLSGRELIPEVTLGKEKKEVAKPEKKKAPEPFEVKRKQEEQEKIGGKETVEKKVQNNSTTVVLQSGRKTESEQLQKPSASKFVEQKREADSATGKQIVEAAKLIEQFEAIERRQEALREEKGYGTKPESKGNQQTIITHTLGQSEASKAVEQKEKRNLEVVRQPQNSVLEAVDGQTKAAAIEPVESSKQDAGNEQKNVGSELLGEQKENQDQEEKQLQTGYGDSSQKSFKQEKIVGETNVDKEEKKEFCAISENATIWNKTNSEQVSLFDEALLSEKAKKEHKIIGQLFQTYWIVEYQEKMFIIDQHAAHEKVLFERTMKSIEDKTFASQMLQPPIILSLSMREEEALKQFMPELRKMGFEIDAFGGREFSVRAVPANLFGIAQVDLLTELIDTLTEDINVKNTNIILEKVASMSCKAAVKGKMKMSFAEAESLIDELMELENPYHCPHGRPVIVSMSKYELEKKFKRIL